MTERFFRPTILGSSPEVKSTDDPVIIRGDGLTIAEVVRVARYDAPVRLTEDAAVWRRVAASCTYITNAATERTPIYGVTTGFGGMANVLISSDEACALQTNLLWFLKAGADKSLAKAGVRAAMLLRANSHLRGISGVRLELIQRLLTFLNAGVTPYVYEFGSIGANGDLVPLASIAGAVLGLDPSFMVDFNGEEVDALTALARLGLPPLSLRPKEGLAMVNGTSVMTGIAANCVHDAQILLALTLGVHALAIQALYGTDQSFHSFVHVHKPHPGQVWTAAVLRDLLASSCLIRREVGGSDYGGHGLVQDRYSLHCLAQYVGPIVDGLAQIAH